MTQDKPPAAKREDLSYGSLSLAFFSLATGAFEADCISRAAVRLVGVGVGVAAWAAWERELLNPSASFREKLSDTIRSVGL